MKTLVVVPALDQVPALFAHSLAQLQRVGESAVAFNLGSLVYVSRNNLAKQAIQMDVDWVLWLDSDMVFNPDLMVKMMETAQKNDIDFLTGLYFRRSSPYSPVLFDKLEIDEQQRCTYTEFTEIPEGLFEVGACGFGCVLMKADVIYDVMGKFGHMFSPIGETGEDVSFCWRARQCGYKIVCDPSIQLGHVGYNIFNRDYFQAFKEQK